MKTDFSSVTACGGDCKGCDYYKSGECEGCIKNGGSCIKMWEKSCEICACCKRHNVPFCGLCGVFPCAWITGKISEWDADGISRLKSLAALYRDEHPYG